MHKQMILVIVDTSKLFIQALGPNKAIRQNKSNNMK